MKLRLLLACVALGACTPEAKTPEAKPADARAGDAPASPVGGGAVTVLTPAVNAKIASPLHVEGVAPNSWFFEGVFPLKLVGADGAVLAEAPARPKTDWQVAGPVQFDADLDFKITAETQATLVLEEDMTEEGKEPRNLHIPVVLTPAG